MHALDLIPGVSRNVFRDNDPRAAAADAEYQAIRPAVLVSHKHTCQFCTVVSREAIEVHHQDCNHANNDEANLKPGCVFCHPVHHLGEIAARFSRVDQSEVAGKYVALSYLPELSQADLSHLLRTIGHVLLNGDEDQKKEAAALYDHLLSYAGYVEGAWKTAHASHFAIALRECNDSIFAARETSMKGLRVIFSVEAIKKLSAKFVNEFKSIPITVWATIMQQRYPSQSE